MTIQREAKRTDRVQVKMDMFHPTVRNVLDFAAELAEAVELGMDPDERVYISGNSPSRWSAFTETTTELDPEWRQDQVTDAMLTAASQATQIHGGFTYETIAAALAVAPKPELNPTEEDTE